MPFEREIATKITDTTSADTAAGLRIIDLTKDISKIPVTGQDHAEEDDMRHEHGQEHADPHVWLDPRNLEKMAAVMKETLAEADPEHAAVYEKNLSSVKERL
ncbi:MAG: zinc ABC transporter substrate-binding protein, partial [Candidatus Electrothrix sp. EH2]|nr:zinc ABC transporter substrate-binding protein [Candidatus Electrothrix sp. EH2]